MYKVTKEAEGGEKKAFGQSLEEHVSFAGRHHKPTNIKTCMIVILKTNKKRKENPTSRVKGKVPLVKNKVRGSHHQASYWPRYRSSAGGLDKPQTARTKQPGSRSRRSDWRCGWPVSGSWLSGGAWWPDAGVRGSRSEWCSWCDDRRWTRSGGNWPPSWPECGPSSCETAGERNREKQRKEAVTF